MRSWHTLMAVLCMVSTTVAATNDQFIGARLFDKGTFAGWDHGSPVGRGWTMEEYSLTGRQGATPLTSGWTFGDFEFHLHWSVKSNGGLKLLFPRLPSGEGLEVTLHESDNCGEVRLGSKRLAEGARVLPEKDFVHTTIIRRQGAKFWLVLDEQELYEVRIPAGARFGLGLAAFGEEATLTDLEVQEPAGSQLFNGRDLAGWWTPGNLASWEAKEGTLTCLNKNGNYLRTEKEFSNFTLTLDYRIAKGGNSGIGIRTARQGWPSGDGMELQIMDEPANRPLTRHSTMAIYGNLEPLSRNDHLDRWNHLVIKSDGYVISAWMNGQLVQHVDTARLPELKHRPLKGWIGFQDHGAKIEFRDVTLLEAPDDPALAARSTSRPPQASELLLDRLMNLDRLTLRDRIVSAVTMAHVDGPNPQTLCELTGPGALVQVMRTNDTGTMTLIVDGNERSAHQFRAGLIFANAPQLAEEVRPASIYVPYRKSLKVLLSEAAPGDYRFEYVTFPEDVPCESCFNEHSSPVARGWLPAISYRYQQLGWGTHREHDPQLRQSSEKQAIPPGETVKLISVDGVGIVEWFKLHASSKVLENDDLWLAVNVDGESQPAVSAPARYLFPGLQNGKNYPNFVLLNRNGFTNLLAMPYGAGLTISATNRGKKPVQELAVSVSLAPASDSSSMKNRLRLRGLFQPATQSATRELIHTTGNGRWIGLVYGAVGGTLPGCAALITDGKTQSGWTLPSMDFFFGLTGKDEERHAFSGRMGGICWRYLLLAPVDFEKSLTLETDEEVQLGDRLALFYMATR